MRKISMCGWLGVVVVSATFGSDQWGNMRIFTAIATNTISWKSRTYTLTTADRLYTDATHAQCIVSMRYITTDTETKGRAFPENQFSMSFPPFIVMRPNCMCTTYKPHPYMCSRVEGSYVCTSIWGHCAENYPLGIHMLTTYVHIVNENAKAKCLSLCISSRAEWWTTGAVFVCMCVDENAYAYFLDDKQLLLMKIDLSDITSTWIRTIRTK